MLFLITVGVRGLGGLVVSALDFQAGYRGFESRSGRDNFQTISMPSSYSTCPGLSIKWTGRRLVTDSGTKCASMKTRLYKFMYIIAITAASMCLGCLVALKIRTTTTVGVQVTINTVKRHFEVGVPILRVDTVTRLYLLCAHFCMSYCIPTLTSMANLTVLWL